MKLKKAKGFNCAKCGGPMARIAGLWGCQDCGHHPKPSTAFKHDAPNEPYSNMKAKVRYDDKNE